MCAHAVAKNSFLHPPTARNWALALMHKTRALPMGLTDPLCSWCVHRLRVLRCLQNIRSLPAHATLVSLRHACSECAIVQTNIGSLSPHQKTVKEEFAGCSMGGRLVDGLTAVCGLTRVWRSESIFT